MSFTTNRTRLTSGAIAVRRGATLSLAALLLCTPHLAAPNDEHLARALREITPAALEADLSFLASDALAGRDTPSPGLETAAEFIASRFRGAGLEGPVNGSYFQCADLTQAAQNEAARQHFKLAHQPVVGRNVIGVLRGSDPKLRNTYVIVSAHYDHIGTRDTADGRTAEKPGNQADRIYNGANDDASGAVSLIALAQALSHLKPGPKRSIVFLAFCGEELGLLGSRFYADHPVLPLRNTIADINLEQIGRTDGDIKKGSASLTGFDYTSLGALLVQAGTKYGLRIYQDAGSSRYFRASDNLSFARLGIPDTTICTSFEFPDYHGLKDEWQKIDYPALVIVSRVVGDVLWRLANCEIPPVWNSSLPATQRYRQAANRTYGEERSGSL